MTIYTVGFTGKPASRFFGLLREQSIELVMDTRLRPDGQLAGFAKRVDLKFFLEELASCGYLHDERLAPTSEILDGYRADKNWKIYVERFQRLLQERNIATVLDRGLFESKSCCFLCSEATPEYCHRRLIAEHLAREWGGIEIVHLV